MKTLFGWIASSITLIYKLPQIYKLYKRKKSNDISVISLLVQCLGYIFYILHGITVKDKPIILMGAGALFETIILILMYFFYRNNDIVNTQP
jgi:MtN3 and saliva related transmembrane protein